MQIILRLSHNIDYFVSEENISYLEIKLTNISKLHNCAAIISGIKTSLCSVISAMKIMIKISSLSDNYASGNNILIKVFG